MQASARRLIARLHLIKPARFIYRAVGFFRYFALGYRYGRQIAARDIAPKETPDVVRPLEAFARENREGPGIWKWEHYYDVYDRHLSRFRGKSIGILEIGVLGGGSLYMWRDYFGPDARIYGLDINPACKELEKDGFEIFVGDQGDPEFWKRLLREVPMIDVVIDDGGHRPHQQVVTLKSLLPHLRPGGVYICEDIHGPFQPFHSFVDGLTRSLSDISGPHERTPASSLHQQVASVHHYPILTVIEKTISCPPTFEAPRFGTNWRTEWYQDESRRRLFSRRRSG